MTLFAEMSTEAIVAICTTAAIALKFVEKVYDRWQLKSAAKTVADKVVTQAAAVAVKVEEVKTQTQVSADDVKTALKASDAKKNAHLSAQDMVLDTIVQQTNGITEKLEKAAFAEGVKSEQDKPSSGNENAP